MRSAGRMGAATRWRLACAPLLLCVALAACAPGAGQASTRQGCASLSCGAPSVSTVTASTGTTRTTSGICAAVACAASGIGVFVEPDAGEAPILHAIEGANSSIEVEVYILSDRTIIHALEDAAGRGVDVRLLLEPKPFGGGAVSAQQTLQELQAAGVNAESADPAFHYTHEKALVVDGATAYILTANLSRSGLGGSASSANRDYGVIDTNAEDVAAVAAIFHADWSRAPYTASDPRLVVSPLNARASLAALIASAHSSLLVEDEEMYDQPSENALIAAARRGVNVEVLLPPAGSSSSSYGADVTRLTRGGVHVRYISTPYMHAKLILADGALAFTGSENFSSTSLDENRELGLMLAGPSALATLGATFARDWAVADAA